MRPLLVKRLEVQMAYHPTPASQGSLGSGMVSTVACFMSAVIAVLSKLRAYYCSFSRHRGELLGLGEDALYLFILLVK